jgi:signal transduction histidine kinase
MQNWLVLAAAVLNITLGLYVLLPNPKKSVYLNYFLFSLVTSLWCFAVFIFAYQGFNNITLFRLIFSFGVMALPVGLLWFDSVFDNKAHKTRQLLIILAALAIAVMSLIGGTVVKSIGPIISADKGWLFHAYSYDLAFQAGPLITLYGAFLLLTVGYFMYRVIDNLIHSSGLKRLQCAYITIGLGLFGIVVILVNIILPLIFQVASITFGDAASTIIFTTFAAIAIIKHRFMDIRAVAARSFAYTILIGAFTLVYGSLAILLERIFLGHQLSVDYRVNFIRIVLAIVMAVFFAPAKKWLNLATDKIFYRNQYDPQDLLKIFSSELASAVNLEAVLQKTIKILSINIKLNEICLIVTNNNKTITSQAFGNKKISIDNNAIQRLQAREPLNFDSLDEADPAHQLMHKYGIRVSVPLKTAMSQYGLLLLGSKNSGITYNSRDMNVLTTLGPEIAINIELWLKITNALRDLETANTHLQELDNAKTEFISLISHNLRTPLTLIQGYVSYLKDLKNYKNKKNIKEYVGAMENGVHRLNVLIEDVILVTSIINHKRDPVFELFKISDIFEDLKLKYENETSLKKLNINLLLQNNLITSDQNLLKIVFQNLFDNAIKFNHEGGSITVKEEVQKDGHLLFTFSDTGIGIPANKQANLFKKFNIETDIMHYGYQGSGLGLYTANLILAMLGGKIWLDSKENVGTNFYVSIPTSNTVLQNL